MKLGPRSPRSLTKTGVIVVYQSEDGERWIPVKPAEVPEWVKDLGTMGAMVNGSAAKKGDSPWYRAEKVSDSAILMPNPTLVM